MVLMISTKNACAMGWFSITDCEELLNLAKEIAKIFDSPRETNTDENTYLPTISKIMSRFYPRMKMGQILAFLEAKPGYGAFVIDFNILKMAKSSAEDKIRLFVARTDNAETSSCITTPAQVNFLLNGKGVEGRTNVSLDTGAQMPTVVTRYLKYGTNLLQAVGQFNGNYIIVIAFMSVISNFDPPLLQDYVQPAVATIDSDSELIEGPSRISLNCPISFRRIRTPVKGLSCKHIQCVDFENFMDINSRRPSWRCPHCNQSACYTNIRVDQNMVKILREVGENIADVIIHQDGSWKAVTETNDQTDQPHDKTSPDGPTLQKSSSISDTTPNVLDLTVGDDEMDLEAEDRKPCLDKPNPTIHINEANQNTSPQIEDDFWTGIFWSSFGPGMSNAQSDAPIGSGISEPVLTAAVSPALNRELETFRGSTQIPAANNLQLQQSQFGNSTLSHEYGRTPSIRHVNRSPIAVQALSTQTQTMTSVPLQIAGNSLNNLIPNGLSLASHSSSAQPSSTVGFNTAPVNMGRQHPFSRSHLNPIQVSHVGQSSFQQPSATTNWDYHGNSISSQPAQQFVGDPAATEFPNAYGVPSTHPHLSPLPTSLQGSQQQPQQNPRMSHPMNHSPSVIRPSVQSSTRYPQMQLRPGGTPRGPTPTPVDTGNAQHVRMMIATQQAALTANQYPVPMRTPRPMSSTPANGNGFMGSVGDQRGRLGGTVQPVVTRAENLVDLSSEQNWRPTARMRGSLQGQAYFDALNRFINQPNQQAQASRPPANFDFPPPPGIPLPPELNVLVANSRNAHALQAVNYALDSAGGPSVPPQQYFGRS